MKSHEQAVAYMGFEPSQEIEVDLKPYQDSPGSGYAHVALHYNGMTLWLNIMCLSDHDCVDIRTFREDEQYAQGVMAIHKGSRVIGKEPTEPVLKGHSWPGAYNVTLMTDREPGEGQDTKPYSERQE